VGVLLCAHAVPILCPGRALTISAPDRGDRWASCPLCVTVWGHSNVAWFTQADDVAQLQISQAGPTAFVELQPLIDGRTAQGLCIDHLPGSLDEGISTWPEFATCVGVYMAADESVHVIAPHGLDDLFELRVRRNPSRVSVDDFRGRVRARRCHERWPRLTICAA